VNGSPATPVTAIARPPRYGPIDRQVSPENSFGDTAGSPGAATATAIAEPLSAKADMKMSEERTGRLSLICAGSAHGRSRRRLSLVMERGALRLHAAAAFARGRRVCRGHSAPQRALRDPVRWRVACTAPFA
jgi:hypothetical protein